MKASTLLLSVILILTFGACERKAGQDSKDVAQDQGEGKLKDNTKRDSEFAVTATEGGLLEVKLGELAERNGSAAEIKELGKTLIDDHGRGNSELAAIAEVKNISVPQTLSEAHQKKYDELAKMTGVEFDKAYAELMVNDHHEDIEEFKKEAEGGDDSEIKTWAARKVPILEHHLAMAENAKKVVNGK